MFIPDIFRHLDIVSVFYVPHVFGVAGRQTCLCLLIVAQDRHDVKFCD